jgi:hypothetical protein
LRKILLSGSAVLALYAMSSACALAGDLPSLKDAPVLAPANPWRLEFTLNGWAPSIISNVGVRNLPTSSEDVGFFKLLQHLKYVVPLSAVARNDDFIGGLDLFATGLTVGASFRGQPVGPGQFGGVDADLHLQQTVLTGFAGARLPVPVSNLSVFGIVGARYFGVSADLTLRTAVLGYGVTTSQSKDWVDPIIGAVAKYDFNEKWFLKGEADIGGYSNSATWHAFGAVGYQWTEHTSLTLGFRALYAYEKQDNGLAGSFRFQETMLGPQFTIGYAF